MYIEAYFFTEIHPMKYDVPKKLNLEYLSWLP